MKKNFFKPMALMVMMIGIVTSCKKGNDALTEQSINLREKPVAEVKKIITGSWKIHYAYGGMNGSTKQDFSNKFFTVLSNDSVYYSHNNQVEADITNYQQKQTIFGYDATLMHFKAHKEWIIDKLKGDTLILKDNTTEPFEYYMTKTDKPNDSSNK